MDLLLSNKLGIRVAMQWSKILFTKLPLHEGESTEEQIMDKPEVVVTGVAGFIGSALAISLLAKGYKVIGIDDLSLGKSENVPEGLEFIRGNLIDKQTIAQISGRKISTIYHLAGQSGAELSYSEPIFDLQSNVQSTLALLHFMSKNGISKIVHASSVAVYGNTSKDVKMLDESMNTLPNSPYAISKQSAEMYLEQLSHQYGVKSASLRLFNVYGPGQDLARMNQGMLSIYLGQAIENGKVLVKGSKSRFRDFVHVDDAVRAFELVADHMTQPHTILNVSTGVKTTVADALDLLNQEFNGSLEISFTDETAGDIFGTLGNYQKMRSLTGWAPDVDFSNGYREMIRFHNQP